MEGGQLFCQEICFWHFCIIVLNFLFHHGFVLCESWWFTYWLLSWMTLQYVCGLFDIVIWFIYDHIMLHVSLKAFNVHIWSLCLLNCIWHFRLTGQRVNDGLWHSVSLNARGLQIIMTLDSEPASTIQLKSYLEPKDKHYFGGKIVNRYFQKRLKRSLQLQLGSY